MTKNPLLVASRAKGPLALYRRSRSIAQRYGLTPLKMDQALQKFSEVLQRFDCSATFPITAVTLKRHRDTITKYLSKNFEFAVHGYTHVDYSHLAPEVQSSHIHLARQIFTHAGINPVGFRSPYLSHEDSLYTAIKAAGFIYVSNQPILWDGMVISILNPSTNAGYERALDFYNPWHISERPSLPRLDDQLVEIPVSLPDDEILIERLASSNAIIEKVWQKIQYQSYQRGELFTLQLHPERIAQCADGLSALLSVARNLTPSVWCARLDEIATWWIARTNSIIDINNIDEERYHCNVTGPAGTTILTRSVEVDCSVHPWVDGYRKIEEMSFTLKAPSRPFIGVSPTTSLKFIDWLRQQGYIVEISGEMNRYLCYFDQSEFIAEQERMFLDQIEKSDTPLVRLGRWPNGARSALAITGDIDALTLWDYGLRVVGK